MGRPSGSGPLVRWLGWAAGFVGREACLRVATGRRSTSMMVRIVAAAFELLCVVSDSAECAGCASLFLPFQWGVSCRGVSGVPRVAGFPLGAGVGVATGVGVGVAAWCLLRLWFARRLLACLGLSSGCWLLIGGTVVGVLVLGMCFF